jgi:MoxR-like ATPase
MRDENGIPIFLDFNGKPTTECKGSAQAKRAKELLYLSPTNALNENQNSRIQDRTNAGKGFPAQELDKMYVNEPRRTQFRDWSKRKAYLEESSNWHMKATDFAAAMEPTRQKQLYIDACQGQIDDLKTEVAQYQKKIDQHILLMATDISTHLWVTADFIVPAAEHLKQTQQDIQTLLTRIHKVREGFDLLPREANLIELVENEAAEEETATQ